MSMYRPMYEQGTYRVAYTPRDFENGGAQQLVPASPLGVMKLYNDEMPKRLTGPVAQRARSPSNRARLAQIHQTSQLRDLLYTKLQVEGIVSKRDVSRKGGQVYAIVEKELCRVAEMESIKALPLPGRFDPGLRPGTPASRLATPDLKHALDSAVGSVCSALGVLANAPTPELVATPPTSPSPVGGRPSKAAVAACRLPHVSVLGRMVPIDVVLREKIQAKYHGGVHPSTHLLRALKQLDHESCSTISIDEFSTLMAQFNLNLKKSTLQSLLIALGLDERMIKTHQQVPYYAFVQAVMPTDYPKPGRFVTSIVDRARGPGEQDAGLVLVNELLAVQRAAAIGECVDGTTADSFEDALRAKLSASVTTGPTELLSQFRLFDKEKKGWISTEEFVRGCAMFNLFPSAEVMAEIATRYFDELGRISFAVFVTSIINAFDFPKARQSDPACSSLLASKLGNDASTGIWAILRDASPTDAATKAEIMALCADEQAGIFISSDDLMALLDECETDVDGLIAIRGFGSVLAAALIKHDADGLGGSRDKLWESLNSTGLPGMGLPWSHGLNANRPFDTTIGADGSAAAAAALFKAGDDANGESHPLEGGDDAGSVPMWGSMDTVADIPKYGMTVDPVKVMYQKLAQKTLGPKQYTDLPKMFNNFAHDPTCMERDEFAAFLQEGLNSNLGRDEIKDLVQTMDNGHGHVDFRRVAALAHPSDYPKKDGRYGGVLTLTHPTHAVAPKHVPWEPRAPDGFVKNKPIDPVTGILRKAVQKSEGAKSAEGAEQKALLDAFKYFDTSKTGHLSVEQIGRVLTRLSLPPSQTIHLLERLNEGGKTEVNYTVLCDKIMAPKFIQANEFKWLESLSEIAPLPEGMKLDLSSHEAKSEISGVRSDKRRYGKRQRIWGQPAKIDGGSWLTALREGNMPSPETKTAALEHRRGSPAISTHFGASESMRGRPPRSARF